MIRRFKELADAAKAMEKKTVVAVVEAQDAHTLEAVVTAKKDGIIEGMLIGNEEKIREILAQVGGDPADFTIVPTGSLEESLQTAVENINAGCVCHMSEIADGDAPHAQKGCRAQAWSASETLRVWMKLNGIEN